MNDADQRAFESALAESRNIRQALGDIGAAVAREKAAADESWSAAKATSDALVEEPTEANARAYSEARKSMVKRDGYHAARARYEHALAALECSNARLLQALGVDVGSAVAATGF